MSSKFNANWIHAAPQDYPITRVQPHLCKKMGVDDQTPLLVYEEVKYEPGVMVTQLDAELPIGRMGPDVDHGDICIVQKAPAPGEEQRYRFPQPQDFLQYVRNRRLVTFKKLEDPREAGFTLELLKDMSYEQVGTKGGRGRERAHGTGQPTCAGWSAAFRGRGAESARPVIGANCLCKEMLK